MRLDGIASVLLLAAASLLPAGCADLHTTNSGAPSGVSTGASVIDRRVQGASGGGGVCGPELAPGSVEVQTGGGTLRADYLWTPCSENPRLYSFGTSLTGDGRFHDFNGGLALFVSDTSAALRIRFEQNGQALATSPIDSEAPDDTWVVAVPVFTDVTDPTCESQLRVDTRIDVRLEHFGRTTILDSHCFVAPTLD